MTDRLTEEEWAELRARRANDLTSFEQTAMLSLRDRIAADELGDRCYVAILDKILGAHSVASESSVEVALRFDRRGEILQAAREWAHAVAWTDSLTPNSSRSLKTRLIELITAFDEDSNV